jgi:hypothetical protein
MLTVTLTGPREVHPRRFSGRVATITLIFEIDAQIAKFLVLFGELAGGHRTNRGQLIADLDLECPDSRAAYGLASALSETVGLVLRESEQAMRASEEVAGRIAQRHPPAPESSSGRLNEWSS